MKMFLHMLLGVFLSLPAFSEGKQPESLAGKLKQITDGKVENHDKWDVRYLFNYYLHDHDIKRIYTGDSTLEERSKDKELMDRYILGLELTLDFRRLVNGVLAHSETQKASKDKIESFLDALTASKIYESKWDYSFIKGGGIKGVMLGFYNDNKLQYFVVFAPDNSEELDLLIGRLEYIVILKLNYTDKGLVKGFDYELRERNDNLNKEIKKIWDSLNIGIWTRTNRPYALMPFGEKEDICSIGEFCIFQLKARLDADKKINREWYAEPIAELEKKKKMGEGLSDKEKEKLKELKARYYDVRLPYEKKQEKKLKHFEDKLEKKRASETKGANQDIP